MNHILDPEVRWLASSGQMLRKTKSTAEQDRLWKDSPFDWIRRLPPRSKGKVGEQLVAGWCAAKGFDVAASGDSDADRIIAGKRVEIKMSILWESGIYKFQQLRDQDYAYVICLGISPFDATAGSSRRPSCRRGLLRSMAAPGAATPNGYRLRRLVRPLGSRTTVVGSRRSGK